MTVIELKANLDDYDDNAEIVVVDFTPQSAQDARDLSHERNALFCPADV